METNPEDLDSMIKTYQSYQSKEGNIFKAENFYNAILGNKSLICKYGKINIIDMLVKLHSETPIVEELVKILTNENILSKFELEKVKNLISIEESEINNKEEGKPTIPTVSYVDMIEKSRETNNIER